MQTILLLLELIVLYWKFPQVLNVQQRQHFPSLGDAQSELEGEGRESEEGIRKLSKCQ